MSPEQATQAIAAQLRPVWGEDIRDEAPKAITLPREAWVALLSALTAPQHPNPETDR